MTQTRWSFERLAQADRATLEQVLRASKAPDPSHLIGAVYNGYNREWLGQLAGAKFRKAFFQRNGNCYGLNQVVVQDGNITGEWQVKTADGRPVEHGYFHVLPAESVALPSRLEPYRHLLLFDYDVDPNPAWNVLMRTIRDFVGMPNEGDDGLLLGKAYLRLPRGFYVFASYFMLQRRIERR